MSAGYSGTPLAKKLGIKEGYEVVALEAPGNYADLLSPLPTGATIRADLPADAQNTATFIHFFATSSERLEAELPSLAKALRRDGMLWLSWPKKAAKMKTDLDGGRIRALGQAAGLVDTKVCAVDETWSGHKFVYRLADR